MGIHYQHEAFHAHHKRAGGTPDNRYHYIDVVGKAQEDADSIADNKAGDDNVVTVVSQVYVTASKTFDGPAVYVTQTPDGFTPQAQPTPTQNSYESAKSVINQPKTRTSTLYPSQSPTNEMGAVKGTPLAGGEISQQNQGMSSGEKAGVAIGVLAAIGLVAGLLLFCLRRRKKQVAARGDKLDEKHVSQASFFSGTAAAMGAAAGNKRESMKSVKSSHTAATAPRLSLRPVTQFLPGILDKSNNANNANAPAMSEKPRNNPFGDDKQVPASNPFNEGDGKRSMESGDVDAAAAVPLPGGANKNANNVYRVQLDFKPSMEDEIELKSGQLVRMVHEYDDGWALCVRMDRTQQGVCPRTCLSKLPVKPRPQGPPQSGRVSPPSLRGPPPHNKMMPRPLTPTGRERSNTERAASPSPMESSRNRSQSVSAASDRSVSPIEAGMPARKPVPGQAN